MNIWDSARVHIRAALPGFAYQSWFGEADFVAINGSEIIIAVPTAVVQKVLKITYKQTIRQAFKDIGCSYQPTFILKH